MRYSIKLSYDGSCFCGWQIQPDAETVQGCLEKALSTLLRQEIKVTGAGRTDTGVNAICYVAHFDFPDALPDGAEVFCYKLNAILPVSIRIHCVAVENDSFHARFNASARTYKYFIHRRKDPFAGHYSYLCTFPLDTAAMNAAARHLEGTHDFSCFEKTGGNNKTSVCTVSEASWSTWTPSHVKELGYPMQDGDYLVFTITADRFLRNMVRAVVGTLIEIGRGKHPASWIDTVLESGSRGAAGESVPGHALFLSGISYPDSAEK